MKQPQSILSNSVLQDAVAEIEANAYRRGVDDTVREFKKQIVAALDSIAAALTVTRTETVRGIKRHVRIRENSNASRVFDAISDLPGLSGADLHRHLDQGPNPVNERTMRTALRRLRVRGLIEKRGGGWFKK